MPRRRADRFVTRHFGAPSPEGRHGPLRNAMARHLHRYSVERGLRASLEELRADLTNTADLHRFPLPPAFLPLHLAFRPFALLARRLAIWRGARRADAERGKGGPAS